MQMAPYNDTINENQKPIPFLRISTILKMSRVKIIYIALLICWTTNPYSILGQVRLPRLVRDSMVVQRDTQLKIWGWGTKGEKVNVNFNGKNFKTTTGNDGKWSVMLSPMKAGGPYTMNITASNKITLTNILVGDVWMCAGQSNMVHYLDLHKERYAEEIAQANYPEIRQFTIPTLTNLQKPADDLPRGNWKSATPPDIKRISVVAYFFAKKLYEQYHVPIGLIHAAVGGTPIEAWTSEEGLKEFPELLTTIQKNKDTAYVNQSNRATLAMNRERAKRKVEDKGLTENKHWYDTSYIPKNWHTINIPGYWEDQGIKDLNGVVWYRKEIDLPASSAGLPAKIALGRIVDADFLYVNGVLVGNTGYQYPQRRYQVPGGLLKAGKNILVVRVINNGGKGGFVPDKPYYLSVGSQSIDLKGYWQYKVGEVYNDDGTGGGGISAQNQPSALFNAMVAPLTDYKIKGILWYQGESNTSNPEAYEKLLPALIADWRNQWDQSDAPFLYVQLPNFMEVSYSPSESQWATLREAQLKTLRIPNTGMAVAIDLGEWNDIHPGNKKPIGERLALAARKVAYGEKNIVYSGPIYQSFKVEGNKIRISFSNVGSGLISIDGEELRQFAVAGPDKKFVWAKAVVENNTVVVWNENVPNAQFVRYAWADNPDGANLYNKEGLPASPFRTDQ
jgi:sialate O-acetylesterase